jgi:hypothetical protein
LANVPSLKYYILLAEREAGDPGGVARTVHLAYLMRPALEGKHLAGNEGADDVVRTDV